MTTERYDIHGNEGPHVGCKRAWEAMGRPSTPSKVDFPFADLNALLHRLWTKAVGTMDYDKPEWQRLEKMVRAAWSETGRSLEPRWPRG